MNFNLFQEGNCTFPNLQIENDENKTGINPSTEIPFFMPSFAALNAFNQNLNMPLNAETELLSRALSANAYANMDNTGTFQAPDGLNLGLQSSLLQPTGLVSNLSVLRPQSEVYANNFSNGHDLYNIISQPLTECVGAPSFYPISNALIGAAISVAPTFYMRANDAYSIYTTAPQWIPVNRVAQTGQEAQRYILPDGKIKYNTEYINKNALLPRKPLRFCAECKATDTPQWRRGPDGKVSLCNACGIRFDKRRREAKAMVGKR
ncbi:uncharacterized protein LOC135121397 [Zophobas morio]|uniref:uncharacterized protein LOC135121397 n=1 Tax=Zophobas morio TaxID=2755281 RepID=UPI00308396CA